jgi:hypothetical protein
VKPTLQLTKGEYENELWKKVEKYLVTRRDYFRRMNDKIRTPDETNILRGRIQECNDLLKMNPETPEEETS